MNAQQNKQISNLFLMFETEVQKIQLKELKKHGFNISHRELIYIVFIKNNEGKRMLDIGEKMGLSKGAFSNTVKTLERKKLIKKKKIKTDKRIITLFLDAKGEEAYLLHELAREKIAKSIGKVITVEEQAYLLEICSKLKAVWTNEK